MTRSLTLSVVLCGLAVATGARAQEFPVPPVHVPVNNGPEPFLTTVVEPENEKNVYVVQAPTRERLPGNEVYFDVPFAVNVPFEVPYEGGSVRVYFDVTIASEIEGVFASHLQRWELQSHGLYRLDGGDIREGSLTWRRQSEKFPLRRVESSPFPLYVNATAPPQPDTRRQVFTATYETPRPPFQKVERGVSDTWEFIPSPIVLEPAAPGHYVFWFSLQPYFGQRGWFDQVPNGNELRAKVVASVVVARSDISWGGLEIASLFGRAKRSDRMVEDKFVRVTTRELPFTVLRDGWVLDRVEIVTQHAAVTGADAVVNDGPFTWEVKPKAVVSGPKADLAADARVFRNDSRSNTRQEEGTFSTGWSILFPVEFPDGGWADVEIGGWRERNPKNLYPTQPPWGGGEHWTVYPEACRTPDGAGPDWLRLLVSPGDTRSAFLDRWSASPQLHGAFIEQPWRLPARGEEPLRYRFLAASPHAHDRRATIGEERKDWPPLVVVDCEPWDVKAHYRRKKDVRAAGTGGAPDSPGTTVVDEEDPFWPWYVTFTALLEDRMATYHAGLLHCGEIGVALEDHRRTQRNLASLLVDSTMPEVMKDRIARRIGEVVATIRFIRDEFDAEAARTEAAMADVAAAIERGCADHGLEHKHLFAWRDAYRDLAERLPVELALLERDEDRLNQVLAAAGPKGLSSPFRVFEASVLAERGDYAGAVAALRRAVTVAPDDPDAVETLQRLECELLKTMLDKSQTAIHEGRKSLYEYLGKRGFRERDSKDPLHWYHFITRPLHAITTEEAWAGFSTGLLDLMGGALGTPGAIGDLLSARESEMARAFLGLHLMLRLRMRGIGFDEMRTMKTEEIFARVPLRGTNGEIYPPERARSTAVALREAMQLPDVKALMDGDWEELRREMARSYWNERDVRETGAEWIGDMFSMKNVLLFGVPMSYGRVAGRVATVGYWGARTNAAVGLAQEMKLVQSGTEVLARLTGWSRLIQAVGATKSGQYLARTLEASYRFEESLSTGLKVAWTVQKVVASMVIQGLAVHLSEEYVGPRAALAMEALLVLSSDSELLLAALRKGGGSPQAAAGFIRGQLIPALEESSRRATALHGKRHSIAKIGAARQRKALPAPKDRPRLPAAKENPLLPPAAEVKLLEEAVLDEAAARKEADAILDRLQRGEKLTDEQKNVLRQTAVKLNVSNALKAAMRRKNTLPPAEVALLREVLGGDWRKRIPRGIPEEDLEIVLLAAIDDVQRGQNRGAMKAAAEMSDRADDLDDAAKEKLRQAKKLAEELGSAPAPPPAKPRNHLSELNGWIDPVGSYKAAEEALDAGRYAEAKAHYEAYLLEMLDKTEVDFDDIRVDIVRRKIRHCDELIADPTPLPEFEGVDPLTVPFDEAEVDEILNRGFRPVKQDKSASMVSKSADGLYYLKELDCSTPDNLAEALSEAEGELVAYELGRALGLDVPATTVRIDRVDDRIVNVKILSKAVGTGQALKDVPMADAHKYRSALSRFKAFSAWLGDWDRHVGNFIPAGKGGRLFSIDHGFAGIRKHRILDHRPDTPVEELFEGYYGRDHFLDRAMGSVVEYKNLNVIEEESDKAFRALFAEQSVTYNAAEEVVGDIRKLCSAEGKEQLESILAEAFVKIYGGSRDHKRIKDLVREASHNLRSRGQRVEDMAKGFNERNGIELPKPGGEGGCRGPARPARALLAFVFRIERRAA